MPEGDSSSLGTAHAAWRAFRIRSISPAGQRSRAWLEKGKNAGFDMLILHVRKKKYRRFQKQTAYVLFAEKHHKNTGKNGKIMIQSFQEKKIEQEMIAHVV
ncbi:MAG: hypothetical protein IKO52_10140 [Clostridia bacterium]|nr:hypothetical protein [Clostridia bacterium]